MRAPDLYHTGKLFGFRVDRLAHALDGGNQHPRHSLRCRDMHGGRKRVVGRLRHVHMIVRMNGFLRSHLAAGDFYGAIRNYLVHVHVGLGPAAGLPNAQRELVSQLAGNHFIGRLHDQLGFVGRQLAQILIDQRGGFLEDAEGANQLRRHEVAPDVKVQQRALSLRPPIDIRRHLDGTHAVRFHSRPLRLFRGCSHSRSVYSVRISILFELFIISVTLRAPRSLP